MLEETYSRTREQYTGALVRGAFVRTGATTRLFRGVLRFTREEDSSGQVREALPENPYVLLADVPLSRDRAYQLVWEFQRGSTTLRADGLLVGPLPEETVDLSFLMRQTIPMETRNPGEWPFRGFGFRSSHRHPFEFPERLIRLSREGWERLEQTMTWWTGVGPQSKDHAFGAFIRVVLPDFRGRISSVEYDNGEIYVTTENITLRKEETKVETLLGPQSLIRPVPEKVRGRDTIDAGDFEPSVPYVCLITKGGTEILDWARLLGGNSVTKPRVRTAPEGRRILRLIEGGENQQMEFKVEVGNGDRLLESICAFANSFGGTILVGVDDHRRVVGVDAKKERDRIGNQIYSKCDPPVRVDCLVVSVEGKEVLEVRVPVGTDRPYVFAPKGVIFIRHDNANRRATRSEMERFYRRGAVRD